ncbi:transforming acidic coiled-coil-containing protein 2 isoform X2 [Hyperolius riggenbachi]|uniref:transforming acidic coiled-coil-containing protein 2 isoform X2 n=1 Tax=Hyperolius riggenbachi TaxID=752182 RepID=UPI0035A29EF8
MGNDNSRNKEEPEPEPPTRDSSSSSPEPEEDAQEEEFLPTVESLPVLYPQSDAGGQQSATHHKVASSGDAHFPSLLLDNVTAPAQPGSGDVSLQHGVWEEGQLLPALPQTELYIERQEYKESGSSSQAGTIRAENNFAAPEDLGLVGILREWGQEVLPEKIHKAAEADTKDLDWMPWMPTKETVLVASDAYGIQAEEVAAECTESLDLQDLKTDTREASATHFTTNNTLDHGWNLGEPSSQLLTDTPQLFRNEELPQLNTALKGLDNSSNQRKGEFRDIVTDQKEQPELCSFYDTKTLTPDAERQKSGQSNLIPTLATDGSSDRKKDKLSTTHKLEPEPSLCSVEASLVQGLDPSLVVSEHSLPDDNLVTLLLNQQSRYQAVEPEGLLAQMGKITASNSFGSMQSENVGGGTKSCSDDMNTKVNQTEKTTKNIQFENQGNQINMSSLDSRYISNKNNKKDSVGDKDEFKTIAGNVVPIDFLSLNSVQALPTREEYKTPNEAMATLCDLDSDTGPLNNTVTHIDLNQSSHVDLENVSGAASNCPSKKVADALQNPLISYQGEQINQTHNIIQASGDKAQSSMNNLLLEDMTTFSPDTLGLHLAKPCLNIQDDVITGLPVGSLNLSEPFLDIKDIITGSPGDRLHLIETRSDLKDDITTGLLEESKVITVNSSIKSKNASPGTDEQTIQQSKAELASACLSKSEHEDVDSRAKENVLGKEEKRLMDVDSNSKRKKKSRKDRVSSTRSKKKATKADIEETTSLSVSACSDSLGYSSSTQVSQDVPAQPLDVMFESFPKEEICLLLPQTDLYIPFSESRSAVENKCTASPESKQTPFLNESSKVLPDETKTMVTKKQSGFDKCLNATNRRQSCDTNSELQPSFLSDVERHNLKPDYNVGETSKVQLAQNASAITKQDDIVVNDKTNLESRSTNSEEVPLVTSSQQEKTSSKLTPSLTSEKLSSPEEVLEVKVVASKLSDLPAVCASDSPVAGNKMDKTASDISTETVSEGSQHTGGLPCSESDVANVGTEENQSPESKMEIQKLDGLELSPSTQEKYNKVIPSTQIGIPGEGGVDANAQPQASNEMCIPMEPLLVRDNSQVVCALELTASLPCQDISDNADEETPVPGISFDFGVEQTATLTPDADSRSQQEVLSVPLPPTDDGQNAASVTAGYPEGQTKVCDEMTVESIKHNITDSFSIKDPLVQNLQLICTEELHDSPIGSNDSLATLTCDKNLEHSSQNRTQPAALSDIQQSASEDMAGKHSNTDQATHIQDNEITGPVVEIPQSSEQYVISSTTDGEQCSILDSVIRNVPTKHSEPPRTDLNKESENKVNITDFPAGEFGGNVDTPENVDTPQIVYQSVPSDKKDGLGHISKEDGKTAVLSEEEIQLTEPVSSKTESLECSVTHSVNLEKLEEALNIQHHNTLEEIHPPEKHPEMIFEGMLHINSDQGIETIHNSQDSRNLHQEDPNGFPADSSIASSLPTAIANVLSVSNDESSEVKLLSNTVSHNESLSMQDSAPVAVVQQVSSSDEFELSSGQPVQLQVDSLSEQEIPNEKALAGTTLTDLQREPGVSPEAPVLLPKDTDKSVVTSTVSTHINSDFVSDHQSHELSDNLKREKNFTKAETVVKGSESTIKEDINDFKETAIKAEHLGPTPKETDILFDIPSLVVKETEIICDEPLLNENKANNVSQQISTPTDDSTTSVTVTPMEVSTEAKVTIEEVKENCSSSIADTRLMHLGTQPEPAELLTSSKELSTEDQQHSSDVPVPTEATEASEATLPRSEAPEATIPRSPAPEATVPKSEAPEATILRSEAPEATIPRSEAPEATIPRSEAPKATIPRSEAPEATIPKSKAPEATIPRSEAPETTIPRSEAPEANIPISEAPEATIPISEAPEATIPRSEAPEATIPRSEAPEAFIPRSEVPEATIPRSEAPEATIPRSEVPEETIPRSEAPEATIPRSEAPEATIPRSEAPKATKPRSEAPEATIPRSKAPEATIPRSEVPEATIPRSEVPEATIPRSEAPEATIPRSEHSSDISSQDKSVSSPAEPVPSSPVIKSQTFPSTDSFSFTQKLRSVLHSERSSPKKTMSPTSPEPLVLPSSPRLCLEGTTHERSSDSEEAFETPESTTPVKSAPPVAIAALPEVQDQQPQQRLEEEPLLLLPKPEEPAPVPVPESVEAADVTEPKEEAFDSPFRRPSHSFSQGFDEDKPIASSGAYNLDFSTVDTTVKSPEPSESSFKARRKSTDSVPASRNTLSRSLSLQAADFQLEEGLGGLGGSDSACSTLRRTKKTRPAPLKKKAAASPKKQTEAESVKGTKDLSGESQETDESKNQVCSDSSPPQTDTDLPLTGEPETFTSSSVEVPSQDPQLSSVTSVPLSDSWPVELTGRVSPPLPTHQKLEVTSGGPEVPESPAVVGQSVRLEFDYSEEAREGQPPVRKGKKPSGKMPLRKPKPKKAVEKPDAPPGPSSSILPEADDIPIGKGSYTYNMDKWDDPNFNPFSSSVKVQDTPCNAEEIPIVRRSESPAKMAASFEIPTNEVEQNAESNKPAKKKKTPLKTVKKSPKRSPVTENGSEELTILCKPEPSPVIASEDHATDEEKLASSVSSQKWTCMAVDLETDKQDYPQPSDLTSFVNENQFHSSTDDVEFGNAYDIEYMEKTGKCSPLRDMPQPQSLYVMFETSQDSPGKSPAKFSEPCTPGTESNFETMDPTMCSGQLPLSMSPPIMSDSMRQSLERSRQREDEPEVLGSGKMELGSPDDEYIASEALLSRLSHHNALCEQLNYLEPDLAEKNPQAFAQKLQEELEFEAMRTEALKLARHMSHSSQYTEPEPLDSSDMSLSHKSLYSRSMAMETAGGGLRHSYQQADLEAALQLAREEIVAKESEVTEWKKKYEESRCEVVEMRKIVAEYEQTIAQMIEDDQKDKSLSHHTVQQLIVEKEQALADLNSVEKSLADLFRRYEKMKDVLEGFRKNEEVLKKCAQEYLARVKKEEQRYHALKIHAEEKLDRANSDIAQVRTKSLQEQAAYQASLRKEQLRVDALERTLEQKNKEIEELTKICDELIAKMGKS